MSAPTSLDTDSSERFSEARRIAVLLIVALLTTLLVADREFVPTESITAGDVATRTIKAPHSFTYQDMGAFEEARERAKGSTLPRFSYDDRLLMQTALGLSEAFEEARSGLASRSAPPVEGGVAVPSPEAIREVTDGFVAKLGLSTPASDLLPLAAADFPPDAETLVLRWLDEAYGEQLVLRDRSELPAAGPIQVVPASEAARAFRLSDRARLTTPNQVRRAVTLAALSAKRADSWMDSAETLALALVKPNIRFDETGSNEARAVASAAVAAEVVTVKRGEILFREGDVIGPRQVAMYRALQRSNTDHGAALQNITLFGFMLLLLGTLYLVGRDRFTKSEQGMRDLAATGVLIVVGAIVTKIVVVFGPGVAELVGNDARQTSVWYMAPVAGCAMLARIIMGRELARFVVFVCAAAAALMMDLEAVYLLFFLLTGIVGSAAVGAQNERFSVLRAGAILGGFGALMVLLVHFVQLYVGDGVVSLAVIMRPVWSMLFAFIGGLLSSVLVLAMVPIFEQLGFVTDYRMLEIANLSHPLMKKLMLSAPGTYHHSVVVGTLAEAACEAIGANGLQAKIAAYFHDIGKSNKPSYFVENQKGGANKHDDLDPITSAHIIISHVTDGAKMAREHSLPKPIIDNIRMHHGTGLLQFFFAKAQMEADDPSTVDESLFRYPGPRPNTREAGVVMLADKVEAATRTIQNPNEENIRAMINRIINSVMADDQFRECPLTFREIYTIADTFVRVLMGIYHQRIEYPGQRPGGARMTGRKKEPGTITLDLERPPEPEQLAGSGLWNEDSLADEDDYEAVDNLPREEP